MASRHEIRVAFDAAAPAGWTLVSIQLKLQADGHSCGDWAHYFRCRVLAYAAEQKVRTCTFPAFLQAELPNLRLLRGTRLTEAECRQRRFATQHFSKMSVNSCVKGHWSKATELKGRGPSHEYP